MDGLGVGSAETGELSISPRDLPISTVTEATPFFGKVTRALTVALGDPARETMNSEDHHPPREGIRPRKAIPLDRNAKARVAAFARAWDRLHRQPGQERGGALGRAAQDVLRALLWSFHNARDGRCFPSYERIAEAAGVARSTVAEAIKALEFASV